ncbi:hypothetical protein OHC33_001831 [Knufia fluminis]|uniref:Restriction of telomere capping protein 4 n=1 Tax=Knufia fluminis TaxID=191047 RepID=A0AAN8IB02_9EURO|nr:hypothetical protein OHC33_001831 [Knufia fluminis]
MQQDSSYSRTYLTAANNHYQPIHAFSNDPKVIAERQARNEQLRRLGPSAARRRNVPSLLKVVAARSSAVGSTSAVAAAPGIPTAIDMADVEEDVNRPPESSDDEEAILPKPVETTLPTPASTQSSQLKRPLQKTDGNRRASKRLKQDKDEDISSTIPETMPISKSQNEPDWLSQASQSSQKKRTQVYKSRKYVPAPQEPATPEKKGKAKAFVAADDIPPTPPSRVSEKNKKMVLLTQSPSKRSPSPKRAFFIPDDFDDDIEIRKGSTTDGSKESLFDKPERSRQRRGSDSSLSSADSFIEYKFDEATRARLGVIEKSDLEESKQPELDPDHVLCPMCKRSLLKADLDLPSSDLSKLPLSKQQKFCFDHRIQDAKRTWAEKGYPEINFDDLGSSSRLRKHIKSLPSIIQRKKTSHYLTVLDDAISAAKGNQTAIKRYFDVTAVTTIHNGYYGPHGAKVISAAIAEDVEVTKALKKATRSDKSFKLAGLGRAIDCVLLPEVIVKLVIEDMNLLSSRGARTGKAEEEARKVLEGSVDVGLMLCGDDDHVEGMDDEDTLYE